MDATTELNETDQLIEVTRMVLANYVRATIETGDDQVARRAARRVELALTECRRKAHEELDSLDPGSFDCHFCGANHDLARDLKEFREKGEVSAVLLMRKFRYRFEHAARAIKELQERGFVQFAGPSLVLVQPAAAA